MSKTFSHDEPKRAVLYRMVMPGHVCPYGLKAKDLLRRSGYEFEDLHLTSREETDAFKAAHDVKTTPQVFIGGKRIGGYDDLRVFLGKVKKPQAPTYRPVAVVFVIAALMSIGIGVAQGQAVVSITWLERFISTAMVILALLKLQNVETFSTMFLNYDVLARHWVPYGYIYPYAEAFAGLLMLAGILTWLSAPIALFIGTVGAWSVFKAVYLEKRELKCACVGGESNVPLGFVSLTENLMMLGMALWMAASSAGLVMHG